MPRDRAREIIRSVGREKAEALYWLLKVAVPQIKGGMTEERGGWVGGILWVERLS
jgi:hypothetical protein